jgi:hypothetical protein
MSLAREIARRKLTRNTDYKKFVDLQNFTGNLERKKPVGRHSVDWRIILN